MSSSVTIERKRADCNTLPKGWQREEALRKSGISAGKVDVYYYSPAGKKIETKPQLARQLGDSFDISNFDFQTGKVMQHLPLPPTPSISLYRCTATGINASIGATNANAIGASNALKRKYKSQIQQSGGINSNSLTLTTSTIITSASSSASLPGIIGVGGTTTTTTTTTATTATVSSNQRQQQLELSRSLHADVSLVPPIRQTASIFKQPVTVVRNHENGKVKHDPKHGGQEKPQQLFWEKRLERLRACHASTGEQFDEIALPKSIRAIGPNVHEQTVLQSLATALHVLNTPVMGQTLAKTEFNKNATAFINPEQPLMQAVLVSEDDIRRQEDRVSVARRKLQEALKA